MSGRTDMDVIYGDTEITPHQAALADHLERVIADAAQYDRLELADEGNGPSVRFRIRTIDPQVLVEIVVYQDAVHVLADSAWFMIELMEGKELVEGKHYEEWVADSTSTAGAFLSAPLRFRVRRTLFRRHETGAIYLQYADSKAWNGDLLSCLGVGRTVTFVNWYVPASSG